MGTLSKTVRFSLCLSQWVGDEHGGHGHINANGVHGLDIDISAIFLTVRNSDQPLSTFIVYKYKAGTEWVLYR